MTDQDEAKKAKAEQDAQAAMLKAKQNAEEAEAKAKDEAEKAQKKAMDAAEKKASKAGVTIRQGTSGTITASAKAGKSIDRLGNEVS